MIDTGEPAAACEPTPERRDEPALDGFRRALEDTPPEAHARIARVRRFLQRWQADPAFRAAVEARPDAMPEAPGLGPLGFAPEEVRPAWDLALRVRLPRAEDWAPWPRALEWAHFATALEAHRRAVRDYALSRGGDPRLADWRRAQHARCRRELGAAGDAILQAPVAWELSRGCSVGCWFCGLDAERFGGHLPYDDAARRLWSGCLETMAAVAGDAVRTGFCYWATDPLDNPDYARFAADHERVTGRWPQATTALALRDPARTRALLTESGRHRAGPERFSVIRLRDLDALHATFSADELLTVDVILHNEGALTPKARAGRALRVAERRARRGRARPLAPVEVDQPTIACISGFLVNLVARTVALVSPCRADAAHPRGYRIHAHARFRDACEFGSALEHCIERGIGTRTEPQGAADVPVEGWRRAAGQGGHHAC